MKKLLDYISIILFFAITAMIGVSVILFQRSESFKEVYAESADPLTAAQTYFKQNFPFRRNWESLYSNTSELMGKRRFGDVYLDSEHDRLIRIFSEYDEERLDKNISETNAFYDQNKNIPAYVLIAPTASGVYRTDLPDFVGAVNEQKLIDEIYYDIDADIVPLDVFNAMYSVRDNYVYCRTDPYWTQAGAYEAYAACISKLGAKPYTVANYDVDYTHVSYLGELSRESGVTSVAPDTVNAYRCKYGSYVKSTKIRRDKQTYTKTSVYNSSALRSENKYEYFLGANNFKCAQIETTNEDKPSLLIIKSDYANCFVPFLAPHFSHITLVDPAMLEDGETVSDYADPQSYDMILFLYDAETFCKSDGFDKLN